MFESVGIITRFQNVAVMRDAIQQGRGHLGVAKHRHPFAEAKIGRDDQGSLLIELTDQVKQQRTTRCREGEIPQLIKDHRIDLYQLLGQTTGSPCCFSRSSWLTKSTAL